MAKKKQSDIKIKIPGRDEQATGVYRVKGDPAEMGQKLKREMQMMVDESSRRVGERGGDGGPKISQNELASKLRRQKQQQEDSQFDIQTSDEDMIRLLSEQQGMEFINLGDYHLGDPDVLQTIPAEIARAYRVLPIKIEDDDSLVVAISDPLNIQLTDDLQMLSNRKIVPKVASEDDIVEFVEMYYGMGDETIENMVEELQDAGSGNVDLFGGADEIDLSSLEEVASQAPIVRLASVLLLQAIKDRASDLHIEPFSSMLRIRYRVDGMLREIPPPPKSLQVGLISRFKVMANLNIAETRRPQDGRIKLQLEGREVDLRVATVPTMHGESIVMRVLDKQMMMVGINQLGMSKTSLERFKREINKPNGIVLVTGPTGCGKTTTLYAALSEINDPGDKIITTEDPVEYEVPGLVQVNINSRIGLTFPACLRAILRQDPDIILVGEIRDLETAQISVQASLTGHLVFSTLHTNSSSATITRLVDMGVEPFLLTSTLESVVGQRLIRTICPKCKTEYIPTEAELEDYLLTPDDVQDITFQQGEGCEECSFTGYKGRIGIFELLQIDDDIRELILQRESQDVIMNAALHKGMQSMRRDGWLKIAMGMSTFEEVARHTPKESEEAIALEMKDIHKKLRGADFLEEKEKPQPQAKAAVEPTPSGKQSMTPDEEAKRLEGPKGN